ncbi:MAG: GNAT family N-acetyltransferase [Bacillus subtilis]|nr:GNAT family N-acetyltransferase [Bacillus subtilis]
MDKIAPLYLEYFNTFEEAQWTIPNVKRRLRQLILREDNLGLLLQDDHEIVGFAVGQLTQFDDGIVFELNELFIVASKQGKGLGSYLLTAIETLAKDRSAFRIQLITGTDDRHHRFYNEKHGYFDGKNNVQKAKSLE